MFDWPMSSPQMMQMFGFLPAAWAGAPPLMTAATSTSNK